MERDELDEMISVLKTEIEAGRIKLSSSQTIDSLSKVRLAADGKVDSATVDSSVRALARATFAMKVHRELRELPLREVQSRYFEILEKNFGTILRRGNDQNATPQQIAEVLASKSALVEDFAERVEDFSTSLKEFWDFHGPVVEAHLEDLKSLKAVFGGDVFPSYTSNIACSVGLYMDTVILPDPLSSLLTMRAAMPKRELFRLFVKHGINALGYRDLALAEVSPPIVVITPDNFGRDENYSAAIVAAGAVDTLTHASRVFGRPFENVDELIEFVAKAGNPEEIVARMADPKRLLFDSEWTESLPLQLKRYNEQLPSAQGGYGHAVYSSIAGRMMMTNSALLRSTLIGGSPIIDAPTSWKYLQWKYEYDSIAGHEGEDRSSLLISNALTSDLLSGLPPEVMIRLRTEGAAAELRQIIGNGIAEIGSASDVDAGAVAAQVVANVDGAFAKHDKELKDLSTSKKKFYGLDVGRYIVNGGVGLTSFLTGNHSLAAVAALSQLTGTPSPDEIIKRYKEIRAKSNQMRTSPVGILFQHMKGKFGFS